MLDVVTPMTRQELRTALTRLREYQRSAPADELGIIFDTIGFICFRLERYAEGLDAHRNAARYDKGRADFLNNAAACLIELGRYEEALTAIQEARKRPPMSPEIDVCLQLNLAEVRHLQGDRESARIAFEEAVQKLESPVALNLAHVASTASVLGFDDDAVEYAARSVAVAIGADLGETPALEFLREHPEALTGVASRSASLAAAIERVGARYDAPPPPDHRITAQISVPPEALSMLFVLVEEPPEPTPTLRKLFHESSS